MANTFTSTLKKTDEVLIGGILKQHKVINESNERSSGKRSSLTVRKHD